MEYDIGLGIWQDAQKEARRVHGKQDRDTFLKNARKILKELKRGRNIVEEEGEEEEDFLAPTPRDILRRGYQYTPSKVRFADTEVKRKPGLEREIYDILGIEEPYVEQKQLRSILKKPKIKERSNDEYDEENERLQRQLSNCELKKKLQLCDSGNINYYAQQQVIQQVQPQYSQSSSSSSRYQPQYAQPDESSSAPWTGRAPRVEAAQISPEEMKKQEIVSKYESGELLTKDEIKEFAKFDQRKALIAELKLKAAERERKRADAELGIPEAPPMEGSGMDFLNYYLRYYA